MDEALEQDWSTDAPSIPWKDARAAVQDGYERAVQIRNERKQVDTNASQLDTVVAHGYVRLP